MTKVASLHGPERHRHGPVKPRPAGSLKAAVAELLAAVGTLERAAEIAGKGRSQVHRYGDPQEASLPTVDLVRIWELAAGDPIVTRYLAAESGFALEPVARPTAEAGAVGLHAGAGQLSGCHGDFFLHLMEALADQVVEPGEAGRLVADMDRWMAVAQQLRQRFVAIRDGADAERPARAAR